MDLLIKKRSRLLESMDLILWFWRMQTCKCSMATSRTSDRFSNPSVISFSSTEIAANMVNWAKLWANRFLMQLASTFILRVIAKLLKRKASISSPARSKGFCRKTRNTVLQLPKFTIKSGDRAKLPWRLTYVYKSFKEARGQRWTKMYRRGLVVQLLARQCRFKLWKKQACLHPER